MAEMLENWFQQRMKLSNRAFRLILLPLTAVVILAVAFWFSYYIPVPSIVLLAALAISLLTWLVCLFMGIAGLKKVRTGDSIMLRRIRSSNKPEKLDT